MTRDIEEALRRSLAARAADVTPDPQLWSRVEARVRRSRTVRLALAGGLGAVALGGVALAAPGLLDRRIELEPGPFASQPAPDATHATPVSTVPPATPRPAEPAAAPGSLVFSDGAAVYSMALDGESAEVLIPSGCPQGATCRSEPIRWVAAHGGAAVDDTAAVAAAGCGGMRYSTSLQSGEPMDAEGACTPSAAFSSDGRHLAWVGEAGERGPASLQSVDWTDAGPGTLDAGFGLPWSEASEVSIQDWVWTQEDDDTATGYLTLRARRNDAIQLLRLPVERQGDGALAITGRGEPVSATPEFAPLAFAAGGPAVTYTLEARLEPQGPAGGKIVRRTDGSPDAEVAVPDELMSGSKFSESDLWMSAVGDTVVFGNAATATAWYVDTSPEVEGSPPLPTQLTATIVHADLLAATPGAPPSDAPTPVPPGETTVDIYFEEEGAACGERTKAYARTVQGPGVLRGALEQLLAGPTKSERAEGARSVFGRHTRRALNDVSIGDNGVAVVDFDNFSDRRGLWSTSCIRGALFAALEPTVRQFSSVKEVVYSFDGSIENFYSAYELVTPPHRADIPLAVTSTQERILDALASARGEDDYDRLARLIARTMFSCSFSDQNEDCIALWQQQSAQGQDPLGPLWEMLRAEPVKNPDAPMWVWPADFVTDPQYLGPRTGIDEDGVWRFYQQGGD